MKGPTMNRTLWGALAGAFSASCALAAGDSAMPVIYPAKNQTTAQTDRDKYLCYDWARAQSGFDPLQAPSAAAQAAAPVQAPATSGADGSLAKGAAGGAAVAELTHGDAGHGAAIGVIGAGVREQIRKQQTQQQKQAQQQAAHAQRKATFERGFAACMEARGYVVK